MLIAGKALAEEIEATLRQGKSRQGRAPRIASILVGANPASELYTRLKSEAATRVGIGFEIVRMPHGSSKEQVVKKVREIGDRVEVSGVMVQMPVPGMSREESEEVVKALPIAKDVDGLRWQESGVIPATVRAILTILDKGGVANIWGKKYAVVGATGSVGKPLIHYLQKRGVTQIEAINSRTKDPGKLTREAEVVISCVGRPGLIQAEMISRGAVAMDVGISKVDGKTVGDMTQGAYTRASVAVPVPGGVGPVTVACLMANAIDIYDKQAGTVL